MKPPLFNRPRNGGADPDRYRGCHNPRAQKPRSRVTGAIASGRNGLRGGRLLRLEELPEPKPRGGRRSRRRYLTARWV